MEYDEEYTRYQLERSSLRKFIRRFYLTSARKALCGPTLDFGCGIGELLESLPEGSMGLEYNRETVAFCKRKGLNVQWYDGFADGWSLQCIEIGHRFQSIVLSHVLEHFRDPETILRSLLASAEKLGVERALIIVPGPAGYRSDPTHLTYIEEAALRRYIQGLNWRIVRQRRFPFNIALLGRYFRHHELQTVLERDSTQGSFK